MCGEVVLPGEKPQNNRMLKLETEIDLLIILQPTRCSAKKF